MLASFVTLVRTLSVVTSNAIEDFAQYFGLLPYRPGPDQIRQWQAGHTRHRTLEVEFRLEIWLLLGSPRDSVGGTDCPVPPICE
jgi:hypothetical protein